ncbi:hypothetical protein SprV_0401452800 [Sparganum proliferum]
MPCSYGNIHDPSTPPSSPPPPLFISRLSPVDEVGFVSSHISETRGYDLPLIGGGDSPQNPLIPLLQTGVLQNSEMRWTQTTPLLDSGDGVLCLQPESKGMSERFRFTVMNAKQSGHINIETVSALLVLLLNYVGSETIPASSPVAVVTSSTAAASTTTTTAAVGTNAIKEVAILTFSTTSSDHGADFAITNPTTNVPLSAGLGGVQTIDATTTALPTATTLGHPNTPNATQSAAAKVVVRTGTPTITSTTTATRMVDLEAGGGSSHCRGVHASVSDAVPRPLPHSVSAPNCTDCAAVTVAFVAETLNPTDITAGTLVSADPFPTTFSSTVSNPRGVEGVESIANINPILLITRPVGNVYLVSTIILFITLPAAGAVEDVDATVTADDDADADAAVVAATTPIHFASFACR